MTAAVQFLFIVIVPLVIVAGGLASLFAVGALFDALENPGDLRQRIDGLFHRPPPPTKPLGAYHYYQPYWKASEPRKAAGA